MAAIAFLPKAKAVRLHDRELRQALFAAFISLGIA
jgi:hypothetical protein